MSLVPQSALFQVPLAILIASVILTFYTIECTCPPSLRVVRNPTGAIKQVRHIKTKHDQKTARYPYKSESGSLWVTLPLRLEYVDDTTAMTAMPPVDPN